MIYKIIKHCILIIIVLALSIPVGAEIINDEPEAVSLYTKAKRLLREGDYYQAARSFEELEARFSTSENLDLFLFNRAKAKMYLGEYSEAIASFQYFVSRFSNSEFVPSGYFFLGNSFYLKGNVNRAVKSYLKAYQKTNEKRLENLLVSSLKSAFENAASISLSEKDFENISEDKKCKLIKPLSEVYISRGELKRANSLLSLCGESIDIDNNPGVIRQMSNKQLEIAMVLPLSGELNSFAQEIYNGAVIAAGFYNQETGKNARIVPYDTKGDPIEAARIIGELAASYTTDVIVGPLTSEEASVSSAVLNCTSMPMVVPAATQAGLTKLSSTSFQLAPNIELEGITLAEYAFRQLNADSVVIISSTASEDLRMSRSFSSHFQKMGGVVVALEYYRSRDKDFGAYLRDIKSLLVGPPVDSLFYINNDGDTLDYKIIPAEVDCIFILGNPKQLRQLLPQIHYYNINGFYLGSDGWGDDVVYRLGDEITKQAVFATPFLEGKNSEEYIKFAAAYDKRYGKAPQRLASLGYDAVRLITRAASVKGVSRDNIAEELSKIKNYKGASGKVSFGEYRENYEMPLYRIEQEQALRINEVSHPTPALETDEL